MVLFLLPGQLFSLALSVIFLAPGLLSYMCALSHQPRCNFSLVNRVDYISSIMIYFVFCEDVRLVKKACAGVPISPAAGSMIPQPATDQVHEE